MFLLMCSMFFMIVVSLIVWLWKDGDMMAQRSLALGIKTWSCLFYDLASYSFIFILFANLIHLVPDFLKLTPYLSNLELLILSMLSLCFHGKLGGTVAQFIFAYLWVFKIVPAGINGQGATHFLPLLSLASLASFIGLLDHQTAWQQEGKNTFFRHFKKIFTMRESIIAILAFSSLLMLGYCFLHSKSYANWILPLALGWDFSTIQDTVALLSLLGMAAWLFILVDVGRFFLVPLVCIPTILAVLFSLGLGHVYALPVGFMFLALTLGTWENFRLRKLRS